METKDSGDKRQQMINFSRPGYKKFAKGTDSRRPKMSREERERHRAEGLCFRCHKPGHFTRNCPEVNKEASTSKVTNQNVDIDFGNIESLREMSENSRRTDGIELSMMDPTDESVRELLSTDYTPNPREIGDPLSERAAQRLTEGTMYPGDNPFRPIRPSRDRFLVYPAIGGRHAIYDSEHHWHDSDGIILIDTGTLMDPNLRLDSWYWVCRGLILNREHGGWISRQERI